MHEYWDVRPLCFYRSSIEGRSVLTQGMSYCMFFVCAVQKNFCWKKINGRKLRTSSRHSCRGFFLFNFFHAFRMILGFVQIHKHLLIQRTYIYIKVDGLLLLQIQWNFSRNVSTTMTTHVAPVFLCLGDVRQYIPCHQ